MSCSTSNAVDDDAVLMFQYFCSFLGQTFRFFSCFSNATEINCISNWPKSELQRVDTYLRYISPFAFETAFYEFLYLPVGTHNNASYHSVTVRIAYRNVRYWHWHVFRSIVSQWYFFLTDVVLICLEVWG